MTSGNDGSFSISGLGSSFANRQRDLFACLDAADKERESSGGPRLPALPVEDEMDRMDDDRDNQLERCSGRRRKAPTKQFRGKESIFKRPEMPAPRRARHSVADHQRNPHKYTKYSLGDVSPQDMSDRTNTAAALSFLQELRARKENKEDMDLDESPKHIIFKSARPKAERRTSSLGAVSTITTAASSEEADQPSFRSSKLVMPEYVVGQKKSSKKKSLSSDTSSQSEDKDPAKKSKTREITLGHLMDEEDE